MTLSVVVITLALIVSALIIGAMRQSYCDREAGTTLALAESEFARDSLEDELDRAQVRIAALELRAHAAEVALGFAILRSEGVESVEAAQLAQSEQP